MKWMTIVGVVRDVRIDSPSRPPDAEIYMPYLQHRLDDVNVVVKDGPNPLQLSGAFRSYVRELNPEVSVKFSTMEERLSTAVARPASAACWFRFSPASRCFSPSSAFTASWPIRSASAPANLVCASRWAPNAGKSFSMVLKQALKLIFVGSPRRSGRRFRRHAHFKIATLRDLPGRPGHLRVNAPPACRRRPARQLRSGLARLAHGTSRSAPAGMNLTKLANARLTAIRPSHSREHYESSVHRKLSSRFRLAARGLRKSPVIHARGGVLSRAGHWCKYGHLLFRQCRSSCKHLPVPEAGRLVQIGEYNGIKEVNTAVSYPFIDEMNKRNRALDGFFGRFPVRVNLTSSGIAEPLNGEVVTGAYFKTLQVSRYSDACSRGTTSTPPSVIRCACSATPLGRNVSAPTRASSAVS